MTKFHRRPRPFDALLVLGLLGAACQATPPATPGPAASGSPSALPSPSASPSAPASLAPASAAPSALPSAAGQPFSLNFQAMMGDEALRFAQDGNADQARVYTGLGRSQARVSPVDFRFYLHGVQLRQADGTWVPVLLDENAWQHEGSALLDFENNTGAAKPNGTAATNTVLSGRSSVAAPTGLRFTLGLPERHNHMDVAVAPAPLNLSRMYWSWTHGRTHARLDVSSPDRQASEAVFSVHLGNVGCSADATATEAGGYRCATLNTPAVELTGFNPFTQPVLADLKALLANTDLKVESGGPSGCMSGPDDPDCAGLMGQLGLAFAGGSQPAGQAFFRVAK